MAHDIIHLDECSAKFAKAEQAIKAQLGFTPGCPRCRLNNNSVDLLNACTLALVALMSDRNTSAHQLEINTLTTVIAAAKGE